VMHEVQPHGHREIHPFERTEHSYDPGQAAEENQGNEGGET